MSLCGLYAEGRHDNQTHPFDCVALTRNFVGLTANATVSMSLCACPYALGSPATAHGNPGTMEFTRILHPQQSTQILITTL